MKVADGRKVGSRAINLHDFVVPAVTGALKSLKAEVEAGLAGNIMMRASGEVLGDFLGLAKAALAEGGDDQKNVPAVLVAASFEDTIRRLAAAKTGVSDRPKLEDVVGILKVNEVLVGASVATAVGYLKFRNDALHAELEEHSARSRDELYGLR